jgi:type III restriction enzyme
MKIHFNQSLAYQLEAIQSVVDLFQGGNRYDSVFSVAKTNEDLFGKIDKGYGNDLVISETRLLENLQEVQARNGVGLSDSLRKSDLQYSIEMETGTGKTYVYLRTIFELNKVHGFTKFIIVVPSVAIREGVKATIRQTREHFGALYDNVVFRDFVYDSDQISQIRTFATNASIEIMIINIDSFNKGINKIKQKHYATGGIPLEVIKGVEPIVILDEPQMLDGDTAQSSIKELNPLVVLRYSATHINKVNLIYRFSAYDAYEQGFVKQIEVAGMQAANDANEAFIRFYDYDPKKQDIRLELDVQKPNGEVERKVVKCDVGDSLEDLTGREIYGDYTIGEISVVNKRWQLSFTTVADRLFLGDTLGGLSVEAYQKVQIYKTIEEHLDKELLFAGRENKIKVLSLFFIDRVANFRSYDEDGNKIDGKYARWFDEAYQRLRQFSKYQILFELPSHKETPLEKVRDGYFSQDKGRMVDTTGQTGKDDSTYKLIMEEKEKLLNYDNPLRFIFSHSALGVGWDNPNVFQICTLNESQSEIKRKQSIGRGLRICVDETGNRVYDRSINTLTVIANETYEQFVDNLQKDIEQETGVPFGSFQADYFSNAIIGADNNGKPVMLGEKKSEAVFNALKDLRLITESKAKISGVKKKVTIGKVTDELILRVKNIQPLGLPLDLQPFEAVIVEKVKAIIPKKTNIKDKSKERTLKLNKQVYLNQDFLELWNKIKYKTTYDVKFDSGALKAKIVERVKGQIKREGSKIIYRKAAVAQKLSGLESTENYVDVIAVEEKATYLPDVLSFFQNETQLTRNTLIDILLQVDLEPLRLNPQLFMEQVLQIINEVKLEFLVDGIQYRKLDNQEYYVQELFEAEDTPIKGYLESNLLESTKSPFDYVRYDSTVESELAKSFENSDNVKVYAKLPPKFKVQTPLGDYNPDWALLWEQGGDTKLYFVLESKGTKERLMLRPMEYFKIKCGTKHFEALGNQIKYKVVSNMSDMIGLGLDT